jgi:hypothetical protein
MAGYTLTYKNPADPENRTVSVFEDAGGVMFNARGFLVEIVNHTATVYVRPIPQAYMGLPRKYLPTTQITKTFVYITPNTGAQAGKRMLLGAFVSKELDPSMTEAPASVKASVPPPAAEPVKTPEVIKELEPVKPPEATKGGAPIASTGLGLDPKKVILPALAVLFLIWKFSK